MRNALDAKMQITMALPKMPKSASSSQLRQDHERHLKQTKNQVERLDQIFASVDESPKGGTCEAMLGILEESSKVLDLDLEGQRGRQP